MISGSRREAPGIHGCVAYIRGLWAMKTITLHLPDNTAKLVVNKVRTILVPIKGLEYKPYRIKPHIVDGLTLGNWWASCPGGRGYRIKPPCEKGDVVRLKTTWGYDDYWKRYEYKVSYKKPPPYKEGHCFHWHSPVTMPKEAVRWEFKCLSISVVEQNKQWFWEISFDISP